jgi:hypothetical protein
MLENICALLEDSAKFKLSSLDLSWMSFKPLQFAKIEPCLRL